ncbi:hypothetical protein BDQ17DRAFT_380564 [Cyathus striatus]|nr:hypothetical protein BDQ17DRAFT_380564 [Cyathus striatus]
MRLCTSHRRYFFKRQFSHTDYYSRTSPPGSSPAPNNGMSPVSATKRKAVIISVCTGAFAVFLIGWAIKKWYLKRRKDLKDARHTQAPRPFPKEEPYNPHGAPATEVVRIAVISRLSEDVVFDISAENNIPDEPHTDVNQGVHPLKEKTSVGSTLTSLTSSSDSGRHLSHRPLHVGSTLTTTNTTTTSLYSNERRSRPLPSRPRASPIPHRPLMMAPPPYYNISL